MIVAFTLFLQLAQHMLGHMDAAGRVYSQFVRTGLHSGTGFLGDVADFLILAGYQGFGEEVGIQSRGNGPVQQRASPQGLDILTLKAG